MLSDIEDYEDSPVNISSLFTFHKINRFTGFCFSQQMYYKLGLQLVDVGGFEGKSLQTQGRYLHAISTKAGWLSTSPWEELA